MYHQVKMSKICLSMEKMTKLCILWSHFLQKHINRYIHVYRRMCRNNLYHTQVNCTTHSKMRTWSGFAYSLSAMYTFILFESFIVLCHFLVKKNTLLLFFKEWVHGKTKQKVWRFPIQPLCPLNVQSTPFQRPPPDWTFLTTNEHTWTQRNHPNSIVYLGFSWSRPSMRLDKCAMSCMDPYSIILKIFTVLKILCAPPIQTSVPANPWQTMIILLSPQILS